MIRGLPGGTGMVEQRIVVCGIGPWPRFAHDVLSQSRLCCDFADHAQRRNHGAHVVFCGQIIGVDVRRVAGLGAADMHRALRFRTQDITPNRKSGIGIQSHALRDGTRAAVAAIVAAGHGQLVQLHLDVRSR